MPDATSDEIAAARHVAYVASQMLVGHATRAELRSAVGAWTVTRKRLEGKAFRRTRGGRAVSGGVTSSEPSGDTKYPHELSGTSGEIGTPDQSSDPQNDNTNGERSEPTKSRTTWLAPFGKAWCERFAVGKAPWGQLAKALRPVVDEVGDEEALKRWRNYLGQTEAAFVSPHKFGATHGSWTGARANGKRPYDPLEPLPGESGDAYLVRITR